MIFFAAPEWSIQLMNAAAPPVAGPLVTSKKTATPAYCPEAAVVWLQATPLNSTAFRPPLFAW